MTSSLFLSKFLRVTSLISLMLTTIASVHARGGPLCLDGVTRADVEKFPIFETETTMTDPKTKLMWKKCVEGMKGYTCAAGEAQFYTWEQAQLVPKQVTFEGFSDWRIPTRKELLTTEYRTCDIPQGRAYLPGGPVGYAVVVWTSEQSASNAEFAWMGSLGVGSMYVEKATRLPVRLVRNVEGKR